MTAGAPVRTASKPSLIHVDWVGDHRFDAGRPGGPTARIDGEGETGQSPPETLLSALATCVSYDVVDILAKQRTPVSSLSIDVVGERVDTIPRRYKHITLNFTIGGRGIEEAQALRAIELSATKYCSVRDSLSSEIAIDWTVDVRDA
ncbi:MAG TPA: OsmC family protein [Gemmatimonadaceae bacterium]|jgi:putative redox protein|nr:OsmC family protein [Gemmatimonadaceae bacterium]